MKRAWIALLLLPLAGCIDGSPSEPTPEPTPAFQQADMDPFFANVTVAGGVDLSLLSQPIHGIAEVSEEVVTASDGAGIYNAVYLPDGDGPFPVFINFSPYWGNTAETRGDNFGKYLIENFVPRGYAVVLSAIRGTGHSEGCFEVASDREAMDLKEIIDHYAAQPWSNGNVAAGGKSYDSTTQNAVIAKFPTPNLKAVFHVSGITDMYEYTFHNGLWARADAGLFQTTYSSTQGINEGVTSGENVPDADKIMRTVGDVTCQENAETVAVPVSTYVTGMKTDYWIERDWTRTIGDSAWNGSIFFYHGYQDWNVQPSHILPWVENLPEQIQTKIWLHQDKENGGHLYPMRTDWNLTMLRWLDHELKGIDTGFWQEPTVEVQATDRSWHQLDAWPPERSEVSATMTEPSQATVPKEQIRIHVDEAGAANATGHTHITGAIVLHANIATINPDAAATAILRLNGQWVGEASLRLIFRDSLDAPSPMVPGQLAPVTLESYPLDIVVGPDDVLTAELGGAPRETIVAPAMLDGVTYGITSVEVPAVVPTPNPLQPAPMPCIAC